MDPHDSLLLDLRERMVRIETKLDGHAETYKNLTEQVEKHDERLDTLERDHRLIVSLGTITLFIVTFFQEPLTNLLGI